ncbi:zinc transporter 10-like isoform X3 [Chiloscyllium plagiosum]|uniref:zinc transporter 10-like isoform X3 n=1 Tax=Chiloscyllium plagiosum TaxID=36176 RepID=UPI001CB82366|nr:zinc transporter 10-like isoform X3 [Chiloscyllium plagiosum]
MGRSRCRNCRLLFMLVITAGFFVVELVVGHMGNSLALVSDSFNMLSDLISLVIGLLAATLGKITRHPRNTYGFARAEVVGALANAVFLTALTFTILVEAIIRLIRPQRIDDVELVLMVGALGLAVNIIGLILFQDCCFKRQVSGSPTGYLATDAGEQRENKAPATASALNIRDEKLCAVDGVHGIHELHIWELAGGRHIATLHVKCLDLSSYETAALQIREIFHNAGIHSVTIQAEFVDTVPGSTLKCNFPCVRKECENKMCCISQNDCNLDAEGSIEMRNNSPGPSRNGFMGNNAAEDNVEELSILPSYDLTTTKQKEGKEATNGLSHLHSTSL